MESSAAPSRGPASFLTQANALLRKNLCFQVPPSFLPCFAFLCFVHSLRARKRNLKTNIGITIFPVLLCVILVVLQGVIDSELDKPKYRCGCACVDPGPTAVGAACRRTECGIQYSTLDQVGSCPIPSPTPWPALVQLPQPESRAVMTAGQPFDGLPDPTCRDTGTCPGTVLFTGNNRSLAEILTIFISTCSDVDCIQGLLLWRESASVVNDELFKGYRQQAGGTGGGKTNEFVAGYDFLNTNRNGLEINIWYNSTYNNNTGFGSIALLRVPRLVNTASNAYIKFLRGTGVEMLLEYVKEMPKVGTQPKFDLSSLLGPLFFTWIVQLLFPVILSYLVYEKQQKLKIMMKMHGLKDGPYWLITYAYFVALSAIYMILLLIFGSLIDNHYAAVVGYIYVFGSGLLGNFLLGFFIEDTHFPKGWIVVMEIIPGFSLYRGLYEFGEYAFAGNAMGTDGMKWTNLDDPVNGMRSVLIIMVVEWAILVNGWWIPEKSLILLEVVFMDEPSTGLDPASRNNLWSVVKEAKKNRAIILTSIESSSILISYLLPLKARYGGTYVLTMTTSSENEQEVEQLVHRLSPNASRIYHISGTQKFELPKQELRIADVFHAVESAKSRFSIYAWGLVDTTLEDVFIKVAKGAQAFSVVA
ncbi:hypothetical protein HU200_033228 [Digitaria exilis]|uniref:Uncharacterized protein n=1 Tax=Digitaria exilis TaxID=1010633 RepID=A0A835BVH3_9POAL|nr:hypothetical protein HU200_033228 [Digitaria exilis]